MRRYPVRQYPVRQYPVGQYPVRQYPARQYPVRQYPVRQEGLSQAPACVQEQHQTTRYGYTIVYSSYSVLLAVAIVST